MNKPSNYDTAKPSGMNIKPKAGYYIFEILHAEEKMSKSTAQNPSKPMLVLHLDIAEGPYKGYFMNKWRMDKKYQEKNGGNAYYRAVYRRITEHVERLKADVVAIEQSNGFKFDWDEKNLIGKKVGGALGEYEYHSYKNNCTETDIEFRPPLVPVRMVMGDELQAPKLRKLQFKDQGSSDWNSDEPLPEYKNTIVEEDLPF